MANNSNKSNMKVIVRLLLLCALNACLTNAQFNQGPFNQCINPNNNPGFCVPLQDCETVMSIVYRQPLLPTDREFVRASECFGGFSEMRHVCCTTDTGFVRVETPTTTAQPPSYTSAIEMVPYWDRPRSLGSGADRFFPNYDNSYDNMQRRWPKFDDESKSTVGRRQAPKLNAVNDASRLPQAPTCGGVTIENKIYGGNDAALGEFPWMVLLEYERRSAKNGQRLALSCAGSLINQRYVITAAHCVRGSIEKKVGPLIAVRLGEHDTSSRVDCNLYGTCAPQAMRVGVEEIVPHPLYKDESSNKQYDIALIRLDRNIRFSDSISPVCLPSMVKARGGNTPAVKTGAQVTVAGWGQTLERGESPVKQKLDVPVVDQKQCQRKFRDARVNIVESQLCAGGKFAQDSCTGDSGGPLMHFRGGVWVLEGIISFGYRCGLLGWPGVYTRVASYENWIQSNLRA